MKIILVPWFDLRKVIYVLQKQTILLMELKRLLLDANMMRTVISSVQAGSAS